MGTQRRRGPLLDGLALLSFHLLRHSNTNWGAGGVSPIDMLVSQTEVGSPWSAGWSPSTVVTHT